MTITCPMCWERCDTEETRSLSTVVAPPPAGGVTTRVRSAGVSRVERVAYPRFKVRAPLIQQLPRDRGREFGLAVTRHGLPADAVGHREQPGPQGVADQIPQRVGVFPRGGPIQLRLREAVSPSKDLTHDPLVLFPDRFGLGAHGGGGVSRHSSILLVIVTGGCRRVACDAARLSGDGRARRETRRVTRPRSSFLIPHRGRPRQGLPWG